MGRRRRVFVTGASEASWQDPSSSSAQRRDEERDWVHGCRRKLLDSHSTDLRSTSVALVDEDGESHEVLLGGVRIYQCIQER